MPRFVRLLEVTEERNGPSGLRDDDHDDDDVLETLSGTQWQVYKSDPIAL